jgi:hypothetical protein
MANQQAAMLVGADRNPATDRSNPAGGAWVESDLNALSTGITFTFTAIGTLGMDGAITTLNTALDQGIHVPIVVGQNANDTAHYCVVLRREGKNYQIHDPWTGETVWRTERNIRTNHMRLPSGHKALAGVDVPTAAPAAGTRTGSGASR